MHAPPDRASINRAARLTLRGLCALGAAVVTSCLVGSAPAHAAEPVVVRDIAYGSAGGGAVRLDVWREPGTSGRPVIVLLHGGGWRVGDRRQWEWHDWTAPWVRAGFVVVVPSYRLSCTPEAGVAAGLDADLCGFSMADSRADARAALSWTVRSVRRYGGDPRRVILMGASAGAQLALLTAIHPTTAAGSVRGIVAISPPADLERIGRTQGRIAPAIEGAIRCSWSDCPRRWASHSPLAVLRRSRRPPPTYLYQSRRDVRSPFRPVVDLASMLRRRGVQVALREPAVRMSSCHGPWACERFRVAGTRRRLKTDVLVWMRQAALARPPAS